MLNFRKFVLSCAYSHEKLILHVYMYFHFNPNNAQPVLASKYSLDIKFPSTIVLFIDCSNIFPVLVGLHAWY